MGISSVYVYINSHKYDEDDPHWLLGGGVS